jgi:hypothetical protein
MGIKWRVFSGADGGNYNQKFWRGIKSAVPRRGTPHYHTVERIIFYRKRKLIV